MATSLSRNFTTPGAMHEHLVLLAGYSAFLIIAALDLASGSDIRLNFLYSLPAITIAFHVRHFSTAALAISVAIILQLIALYAYHLPSISTLADSLTIAISGGIELIAGRALRGRHLKSKAEASSAKLSAALESMSDAVLITDVDGQFVIYNQAFAIYHRFRNKEECARRLSDYPLILDVMNIEGELLPLDRWAVPRALSGETAIDVEYMLRLKATGETWIGSYNLAPIRAENGSITGSVVVVRDVTLQKRAEHERRQDYDLLLLAENSAVAGSWSWNFATGLLQWSPQRYHLFGLNPEIDKPSLATWRKTLHPEDQAHTEQRFREAIEHQKPFTHTYRVILPGGHTRWIDDFGTVTYDSQHKPVSLSGISIDVTVRETAELDLKRTLLELHNSQEMLLQAERGAEAGSWSWNLATGKLSWSEEFYRLFGLNPKIDKPSLSTWRRSLHPDDCANAERRITESVEQHTPLKNTYRVVLPDGGIRWIDAIGSAEYDEQGKPVIMSGMCFDATRRKIGEEKLPVLENTYRGFFDNVSVGAGLIDSSGHFIDVNPRLCEMTGYSARELLDKMSPVDLTSPDHHQTVQQGIARTIEGRDPVYHQESLITRKDGRIFWVDVAASPIRGPNGEIQALAGLVTDITQRKTAMLQLREREANLRAFFENAAVGAVLLDCRGRYAEVNSSYSEIVGYSKEELIGKLSPPDLDAPESAREDREKIERILSGLDSEYTIEKQIVRKDGSRRWVLVAASIVKEATSQGTRIASLVMDTTSRRRSEEQLRKTEDELRKLNAELEAKVRDRTIALEDANKQLIEFARIDILTQIPNRLAANERLSAEWAHMKRTGRPYVVLMADIDHFKMFNDTYGHEAGDRVLKAVAQRLQDHLREIDFVARFGGEEFLVLLPETDLEGGLHVARNLRQAIEEIAEPGVSKITVSIGCTTARPEQDNEDAAVKESDNALYTAKAAGRNRVALSSGLMESKTPETAKE